MGRELERLASPFLSPQTNGGGSLQVYKNTNHEQAMKKSYRLEEKIAGRLPSGKLWSWRYVPENSNLPLKIAMRERDRLRRFYPSMRFRVVETIQKVIP